MMRSHDELPEGRARPLTGKLNGCCVRAQNSSRYVEIFTSNREEVDRRVLTGVMLY